MDNTTLPPLFDHMDNVDISSPSEEPEIFQSAIQVCVSLLSYHSFFSGFNLALIIAKLSNYSHNFFAELLSPACCAQRPFEFMLALGQAI